MSAEAAIAWLGYARENLRTAQWAFGKLRDRERSSVGARAGFVRQPGKMTVAKPWASNRRFGPVISRS